MYSYCRITVIVLFGTPKLPKQSYLTTSAKIWDSFQFLMVLEQL